MIGPTFLHETKEILYNFNLYEGTLKHYRYVSLTETRIECLRQVSGCLLACGGATSRKVEG